MWLCPCICHFSAPEFSHLILIPWFSDAPFQEGYPGPSASILPCLHPLVLLLHTSHCHLKYHFKFVFHYFYILLIKKLTFRGRGFLLQTHLRPSRRVLGAQKGEITVELGSAAVSDYIVPWCSVSSSQSADGAQWASDWQWDQPSLGVSCMQVLHLCIRFNPYKNPVAVGCFPYIIEWKES